MHEEILFRKQKTINCRGNILELGKPLVMGILNITPDSFFDGGKYINKKSWIDKTTQMLNEGAKIIDVGAVSTRPGADMLSEKEEISRLIPVLESLSESFPGIILSVDTFRARVAEEAVRNGASIINDISAGGIDKKMFETIAKLQVPYIMMHMQGKPENMQDAPKYNDVIKEVIKIFAKNIKHLRLLGVNDIIIDPGFGFGKNLEHNFELLAGLKEFKCFEVPLMVGLSRKSMINKILKTKPKNALIGTTVLNTIALMQGTNILRVHDVKEAVEVIKLVFTLKEAKD
ncbi:MAG: dihydropteroate synthase [Bacteroidales bacterium]|nr:dihydropteroate synthase [Bacteroidales bacterium]